MFFSGEIHIRWSFVGRSSGSNNIIALEKVTNEIVSESDRLLLYYVPFSNGEAIFHSPAILFSMVMAPFGTTIGTAVETFDAIKVGLAQKVNYL